MEHKAFKQRAYDYAMFLLGIRLRTEGELREKMRSKKYNADVVENVINQLKENRYIDDQRFAEVFLENLKKYKSWGYYGIKKKMLEKKLPPDIIESVLSEGLSEAEEMVIAKRFWVKEKLVTGNQGEKASAARKLAAKGFRGDIIAKLLLLY